jgi:DNA-binding response OmpR family regulator
VAQPLKILIAEDDRMTRRILQYAFDEHEAFADREFEVTLAEDGAQALEHFGQATPDLVIADLFMPRVDGFALCQSIREHANGMDVPIIVMSAVWKQPQLLDRLKNSFGVVFLEKPFKVGDLIALVISQLQLTA